MCGENGNLVAATYEKSLTKSSKLKAAKENVTEIIKLTGQYFLLDKNKASEVGTCCGTPDRVPYIGRVPKYAYTKRELANSRRDAKAEFNIADECFAQPLHLCRTWFKWVKYKLLWRRNTCQPHQRRSSASVKATFICNMPI